MKLFLFIMVSVVSFPMIAMEKKEEPQVSTFTTGTTCENLLQINVQLLHNICKSLENLNHKVDRIDFKVTLMEKKVAYGFGYVKKSDPDFLNYVHKEIQDRLSTSSTTTMSEEEQMRLAMELSLQAQVPMETEEKQGSD